METATETTVTLNLTEYEASILTGALLEFQSKWQEPEDKTAEYLRNLIIFQTPWE